MADEYVTRQMYDAEMAALKAEVDNLKALVSVLTGSVRDLQNRRSPLDLRGSMLP